MIARSLTLLLVAAPLLAQQTSTSSARAADFRWEKALAAGSQVSLHNLNGDVTVSPSTSGKVEVVGIKKGRYPEDVTLEVVETARGIQVCAMFRDKDVTCDEDGYRVHEDRRWDRRRDRDHDDTQIDIVVKVPKDVRVRANSVSGDVEVVGAEGELRAGSVSGNVRLDKLRATTRLSATSVSGDVWVVIESLAGEGDLRFTSVSGNVTAELPKNIDADVRMRSVSGSLDSDFPLTLNGRMNRHSLEARIGKGGRELEVTTVSGDVRLRSTRP
jgi:DUF4097 and DUF4098 domain-containing protein YvlB